MPDRAQQSGDPTPKTAVVSGVPANDTVPGLETGTMVGRYVVLETLGMGGMGFVVRAYDPKLCREVALKRVLPQALADAGSARLVREAQAMAQLSHVNVVAVYDVEVDDDGVTLVMEYVPGQTLRTWTRAATRSWGDLVQAYVHAGRGLAAAHRAGVVHRDFKPTNVLITPDGAVKVTDFGLARPIDAMGESSSLDGVSTRARLDSGVSSRTGRESGPSSRSSRDEWDANLTRPDEVMGTPRYMAPEQHEGAAAGASADQFAFCVALWEALCGAAPYPGDSGRVLYDAKRKGPPEWPKHIAVPRRLVEGLVRGLAPDPAARFATMDDLLHALEPEVASPRRRAVVFAASAAVVAVAGLGIHGWVSAQARVCSGSAEQIAEVWNDDARARVRDSIAAQAASYAADTATRTSALLDAYAEGWALEHTEACEATSVRGEQSSEALDLRMACLRRAKTELATSIEVLADADPALVEKAIDFVQGLPRIATCTDVETLRAEVPPPDDPEVAQRVAEIRDGLAEVHSLERAARFERAEVLARELDADAVALAYPPLVAEAAVALGNVLEGTGKFEEAEATLRRALDEGLAAGARRLALAAAMRLTLVVSRDQERPAEAQIYGQVALGLVRALRPGGALEAAVRNAMGSVMVTSGKYAEAEAAYRVALEMTIAELGEDSLDVASARNNLATALYQVGRLAEAEEQFAATLAINERMRGPEHPTTARARNNLANLALAQGRHQEAADILRGLVQEQSRVLGPDHPSVPQFRFNLANALQGMGRYEESAAETRLAIASWERTLGPKHSKLGQVHNNLANTLNLMGKYEEAVEEYQRALELFAPLGPEHPYNAYAQQGLGAAYLELGRLEESEAALRRGLQIAEKAVGDKHTLVADATVGLAAVFSKQGRKHEAVAMLERGWAIDQASEKLPPAKAATAFKLAQALWDQGEDRARALKLAEEAKALHGKTDPQASGATEIDAWLRARSGQKR